jgi:S1-C subfamily serine protease
MARAQDKIRHSVIKIFTQSDAPDYDQPWQTEGAVGAVGSGLIVSTRRGPRVLTNAHVVENQVFVEVRRYGQTTKYVAEVEGVGHECDLALLSVVDESFFDKALSIEIGELPTLGDHVSVFGYPVGGDRLSVTRGIVSRIEMTSYVHSQRRLLSVQIDAAINAGNSGGPVVNESGKLVGVAFQAAEDAENIGYMIGAPVVRHFLKDIEDGDFDGFPELGVQAQNLTSAAHRKWLGLSAKQQTGALVTNVVYRGSAWGGLERGDVLLKLASARVASDCSVKFRSGGRIHFSYLVAQRHVGDMLRATFSRDGKTQTCDICLLPPRYLVAEDRYDVKPTYFVYGGLLFVPLSRNYLKTWGEEWWSEAPPKLIAIYEGDVCTSSRQEVVILQSVLADRVTQGYHDLSSEVVTRVQGKKIRHLRHLVRILEDNQEDYVRFELDDGRSIVLERAAVEKRQAAILNSFGIPHDRSADLRKRERSRKTRESTT